MLFYLKIYDVAVAYKMMKMMMFVFVYFVAVVVDSFFSFFLAFVLLQLIVLFWKIKFNLCLIHLALIQVVHVDRLYQGRPFAAFALCFVHF